MNVCMYKMVSVKIFYCVVLGNDWDKAILDHIGLELYFLQKSFDESCECYQIGGSTDDSDVLDLQYSRYYRDDSGIMKAKQ